MAEPEKLARRQIEAQLAACGWAIQDYKQFNPSAGRGIALREAPLKSGTCNYLLLVDRKAAGVIDPAAVPDWQKFERQFSTTHDLRLAKNPREEAPGPIAWRGTGGAIHIVANGPWKELRKLYEKDIFSN